MTTGFDPPSAPPPAPPPPPSPPPPGGSPYGPPAFAPAPPASPLPAWLVPANVSGWAVAAGYFGLFSVLCLPGPIALWCGIKGLQHVRRTPGLNGTVRSWVGIVLGALGTLMLVGLLVLSVVAVVAGGSDS